MFQIYTNRLLHISVEMSEERTSPPGSGAQASGHTEPTNSSGVKEETNGTAADREPHAPPNPAQALYAGQHETGAPAVYSSSGRAELNAGQLQSSEVENFFSNLDTSRVAQPVVSIPSTLISYDETNSLATLTSAQSSAPLHGGKAGYNYADFYKSSNMFVPTSTPLIPHAYSVTNR